MALFYYIFLAWLIAFTGTWLCLPWLKRFSVLDTPNARSNHSIAVPRGGGIAIVLSSLTILAIEGTNLWIITAGILLAFVSFIDDMKGLGVRWRLLVQIIAVIIAISTLQGRLWPQWVAQPVEWLLIGLGWIWYINLTNFMDGIDEITSMQTIMVSIGVCLLVIFDSALPLPLAMQAGIIASATLGFYWFNRSPARIFMGDVGSVFLGFITFYLLVNLALHGVVISAIILPAYYLSDATLTLVKRLLRGETIWQAHSEHAYQKAVRKGLSHTAVVRKITLLNIFLILLAILATYGTIFAIIMLVIAYAATACMIKHLVS